MSVKHLRQRVTLIVLRFSVNRQCLFSTVHLHINFPEIHSSFVGCKWGVPILKGEGGGGEKLKKKVRLVIYPQNI